MPFALYFYKRDHARRMAGGSFRVRGKTTFLFGTVFFFWCWSRRGAFFNVVVNILQIFIDASAYQEEMALVTEGKSLLMMVFWMGIVRPVSEEMVFRWLVYLRLRDYMRVGGEQRSRA